MKRRALVALLAVALPTACTIVTGLRVPPPSPTPAEAGDSCQHASFPPPPPGADQAGAKDIVVAVRRFDLGLDAGAPVVGFDLDGVCTTCDREGGAGESCATTTQHCDDDQGRDNTTQTLFRHLQTYGINLEESLNANIQGGLSTFVMRVQDYNGTENDPEVLVSIFGSSGMRQPLDDGGIAYTPPAFDGSDRWSVNRSQLAPSASDPYISIQARKGYVTGHQLVVPEVNASIPLRQGVSMDLDALVLVATIDPGGATITDGTLAGRWPVGDALSVAGEFPIPTAPDQPLCTSPFFDSLVKPAICPAADLTVAVDGGASAPCDALSIGFAFATAPAAFGGILDEALAPPRCPDLSIFHCP